MRHLVTRAVLCASLAGFGMGCAPRGAPTVLRVQPDGSAREEVFVSPFQYEHFILGERALAMGRPREAAAHYARARAGASDDPLAMARHAEALAAAGRSRDAASIIERGLSNQPRSEALHLAAARIAEASDDPDGARARYRRARQALPGSEAIVIAYVALLERHGERQAARDELESFVREGVDVGAASLRVQLQLAVSSGDGLGAVDAARRYLRHHPHGSPKILAAVRVALDRGATSLAAALVDEVPSRPAHLALRVEAFVAAGRFGAAESALALATPEDVGGAVPLAQLYLLARRPDLAIELLSSSTRERGPGRRRLTTASRHILAEALLQTGDPARAVELLEGDESARASTLVRRALQHAGMDGLSAEQATTTPQRGQRRQ